LTTRGQGPRGGEGADEGGKDGGEKSRLPMEGVLAIGTQKHLRRGAKGQVTQTHCEGETDRVKKAEGNQPTS